MRGAGFRARSLGFALLILLGTSRAGGAQPGATPPESAEAAAGDGEMLWRTAQEDRRRGQLGRAREELGRCAEMGGSSGDARLEARCLTSLAEVESLGHAADAALVTLDRARESVARSGDRALEASLACTRGWAVQSLGRMEDARTAFDEAAGEYRTLDDLGGLASALTGLATLLQGQGKYGEAMRVGQEAVDAADRAGDAKMQAIARIGLGRIQDFGGKHADSRRTLEAAAARASSAGFVLEEMEARRALIALVRQHGKLQDANRHLTRSRALAAEVDSPYHESRVEIMTALLAIDALRYPEAVAAIDAALPILRKLEAPLSEADAHSIKANALYRQGEYDAALASQRAAIAASEASGRMDATVRRIEELANFLVIMGDSQHGLEELERAVQIRKTLGDDAATCEARANVAQLRFEAGDRLRGRKELEEALSCFDRERDGASWATAKLSLLNDEIPAGPERTESLLREIAEVRAFAQSQADSESVSTSLRMEAEQRLATGDSKGARRALQADARLGQVATDSGGGWVHDDLDGKTALAEGDRARAIRSMEKAVARIEKWRSSSDSQLSRAAIVERRLDPYQELVRLRIEDGDIARAYATARLAKARTFAERVSPRAAFMSGRPPGADTRAAELQTFLHPDEVLLDYFALQKDVVVFVIRAGSMRARLLGASPDRIAELTRVARYPGRPDPADAAVLGAWRTSIAKLGETLLTPILPELQGARRILVVPTGALAAVPFPALEIEGRPLFAKWGVAILPAAEVLRARQRPATARHTTLALGDPDVGRPEERLPGAAREARLVAEAAGPGAFLAVGPDATEAAFLKRAPEVEVIHVAAHGRLDPWAPWASRIELAAGEGSDGRLTAEEIARLKLSAELVVLSGCATGRDPGLLREDSPADEREGLVRAFLSAGALSVVASLWELDDEASASILPALHPPARVQSDPVAALAALQRDLAIGKISSPAGRRLDHPFYWAALAAYGPGR